VRRDDRSRRRRIDPQTTIAVIAILMVAVIAVRWGGRRRP
jgi:hypothetical protein